MLHLGCMESTTTEHHPTRLLGGSVLQPIDRSEYVEAMSRSVIGVCIVSTDGPAGRLGITVTSATSLSVDPPRVLVCIGRRSPACRGVRKNGVFTLNLLASSQRNLAEAFAGRPGYGPPYDFADADWLIGQSGPPRLRNAVAAFDCQVVNAINAGSHTIFIAMVIAAIVSGGTPLLYTGRAYGIPICWRI